MQTKCMLCANPVGDSPNVPRKNFIISLQEIIIHFVIIVHGLNKGKNRPYCQPPIYNIMLLIYIQVDAACQSMRNFNTVVKL